MCGLGDQVAMSDGGRGGTARRIQARFMSTVYLSQGESAKEQDDLMVALCAPTMANLEDEMIWYVQPQY